MQTRILAENRIQAGVVYQSPVTLDLINKMPLFGKASKSPVELVRVLKESLLLLEKGADGKKQVSFPYLLSAQSQY